MNTEDRKPDVIVVGGGIVGCSTAFYCALNDLDVYLLEQNTIGSRSSGAAAGLLSPPDFASPGTPLSDLAPFPRLCRAGYDFYPAFLDRLQRYSNHNVGYKKTESLSLVLGEDELSNLQGYGREMEKYDRDVEWWENKQITESYSAINPDNNGGLYISDEALVDPPKLMEGLEDVCREVGIGIYQETEVQTISPIEDESFQIVSNQHEWATNNVVVSAGCWTAQLLDQFDVTVPIEPRKGHMIRYDDVNLDLPDVVKWDDYYLIQRNSGHVEVGATTEDAGFSDEINRDSVEELREVASNLVPELSDRVPDDTWSGLRPYLDMKGGPLLSEIPGVQNLYVAAGHYKSGILQGPVSGKIMAQKLTGTDPLIPLKDYCFDRD
ncbi:MAG: NAD(P)/FAD-dependent oxidoreductase [bacterium]